MKCRRKCSLIRARHAVGHAEPLRQLGPERAPAETKLSPAQRLARRLVSLGPAPKTFSYNEFLDSQLGALFPFDFIATGCRLGWLRSCTAIYDQTVSVRCSQKATPIQAVDELTAIPSGSWVPVQHSELLPAGARRNSSLRHFSQLMYNPMRCCPAVHWHGVASHRRPSCPIGCVKWNYRWRLHQRNKRHLGSQ